MRFSHSRLITSVAAVAAFAATGLTFGCSHSEDNPQANGAPPPPPASATNTISADTQAQIQAAQQADHARRAAVAPHPAPPK